MKEISIDIETYSDVDLQKCGTYKYAQSRNFEVLLFSYFIDGSPITCVDLACGETIPKAVLDALTNENVTKWAYNAMFKRVCLSEYLRRNHPDKFRSYSIPEDSVRNYLDPSGWKCDMIGVAYLGLPLKLADSGRILGLDEQKMVEGKELKNISVYHVSRRKQTETEPATFLTMILRRGLCLRNIIFAMLRSK